MWAIGVLSFSGCRRHREAGLLQAASGRGLRQIHTTSRVANQGLTHWLSGGRETLPGTPASVLEFC
jgi:hypothetical protein